MKAYNKQWYQDNKERILKKSKRYYLDNKEKKNEQGRQYRQDHKEEIIEYNKQYRKKHKECISKYAKQYYLNNKEYVKEQARQYYFNNKEQIIKYRQDNKEKRVRQQNQWRGVNKKHCVEYRKQYSQTLAGKACIKVSNHNRRTLLKGLTKETVQRVYEDNIKQFGTLTCVLCGKPVEFKDSSLEHLTPISRGGNNDYNNLGVAHLNCNVRKHAMTIEEWFVKTGNNVKEGSWSI